MSDPERAHLEPEFYPTVDGDEVQGLRASKDRARSRWRRSLVELVWAARQAARRRDDGIAHEAHDEHLAALHEWKAAEAAYIAARLGFRHEPLPPR
jgi:hypothetical protein